ncbi:MAG TPA: nuclear transport factor 2 family protein [Streptosporangiaceae bacterium]
MTDDHIGKRAARHIAAFNDSVRSGGWADFAQRFAPDATMRFVGVPVGPMSGRDEIAAGYAAQPPSDTLAVTRGICTGDVDELWFRWDSTAQAGTMVLRWSDDLIAELVVTFS